MNAGQLLLMKAGQLLLMKAGQLLLMKAGQLLLMKAGQLLLMKPLHTSCKLEVEKGKYFHFYLNNQHINCTDISHCATNL